MMSYYKRKCIIQGRIQDFKLGGGGGAHLKKLRRAEGGTKIFGVFRAKNHDFTPKNHIFSNYRGGGAPPWIRPCNTCGDLTKMNDQHTWCA